MNTILLVLILIMLIVIKTSDQIEVDHNPTPDDKDGLPIIQ